jgi:hypothetical protein
MALSHKGRYWQISGLEKQVGSRAIIYISAPAGECSNGRFRALFGGARRSERTPCFRRALAARFLLSYTAGGGGRQSPIILAGRTARLVVQIKRWCATGDVSKGRTPALERSPRRAKIWPEAA